MPVANNKRQITVQNIKRQPDAERAAVVLLTLDGIPVTKGNVQKLVRLIQKIRADEKEFLVTYLKTVKPRAEEEIAAALELHSVWMRGWFNCRNSILEAIGKL